jgi:hypothetical protein
MAATRVAAGEEEGIGCLAVFFALCRLPLLLSEIRYSALR